MYGIDRYDSESDFRGVDSCKSAYFLDTFLLDGKLKILSCQCDK